MNQIYIILGLASLLLVSGAYLTKMGKKDVSLYLQSSEG